MMTPSFQDQSTVTFHLSVEFEGIRERAPESRVYALNCEGKIIASQKVKAGIAEMTLPVAELFEVSMAIGPSFRDPFTHQTLAPAWHPLFNTDWEFVPGMNHYALPSVPENIWRWWLVRSLSGKLWPKQQRGRRLMLF